MKNSVRILFLTLLTFGADTITAKERKSDKLESFYGGLQFSTDFNNWTNLTNDGFTSYSYLPRFSHNFGFELVKQYSDHFLVGSGFTFRTLSFSRTEVCNTCGDATYEIKSDYKAKYREIPLRALYVISNQKLDVIASLGFINSFRSKVAMERVAYDGRVEQFNATNSFRPFFISLEAGIGFNYSINYDFSWGMNLLYRQPFSTFNVSGNPAVKFWNIGINTAFYYHF